MKITAFSLKLLALLSLISLPAVPEVGSAQTKVLGPRAVPIHLQGQSPVVGELPDSELALQEDDFDTLSVQYASVTGAVSGGAIAVVVLFGIGALVRPREVLGWVRVPDRKVGIVFKHLGRPVPGNQVLARNGEAGPQADTLSSGWHFFKWPWMCRVVMEDVTYIFEDEIGWVIAKDGVSAARGERFGKVIQCDNFQDGKAFLNNGGQRGKQRDVLTTGTYRINTALFEVHVEKLVEIKSDQIGLVEAQDGAALPLGQPLAEAVECNSFQDEDAFFEGGGQRGMQTVTLGEGTYQINPALFKVTIGEVTNIPPGKIGLVEAKDGAPLGSGRAFGKVVECDNFQDADRFLKEGGQKGRQINILRTGNYQINTALFEVIPIDVTRIEPGKIGLVTALGGATMPQDQNFGRAVDCNDFQDTKAFLDNKGQKGKQLSVLDVGTYYINTYLFRVYPIESTEIAQGEIGLVEATDGISFRPEQILGDIVDCNNFQNAQAFLENSGQKGKQLAFLMAGQYKINTELFKISAVDAVKISPDHVGLVKAKGGNPIKPGQSFGQYVECNDYQDASAFLRKGGQAGKQLAILTTGTYYINTDFFNVSIESAIKIASDKIGIVEAQAGAPLEPGQAFGRVVNCNSFQDAQLFFDNGGQRGRQLAILTAGTYQLNTNLFNVTIKDAINIFPEEIGLVEATGGAPLDQGKIFGKVVDCNSFQSPEKFFNGGGQRGQQLSVLSEGTYQINTELFKVQKEKVVLIGPDEIGLVIANDGVPLDRGQTLAKVVDCDNFQDAEAFFKEGGQKGKQLSILTAGKYRINTKLFTVVTPANASQYKMSPEDLQVTEISADSIGIVTTFDGQALDPSEIAGSVIPGHENFQNRQPFIDGGGQQGLQEEILPAGRWNLNPWFVKVESVPFTQVPNGHVGVIKSYVGKTPESNTKLVDPGYKGICKDPLEPGKYPINTATKDVVLVPTNDLVLKWSNHIEEATQGPKVHRALPALKVNDKNGFTFTVEVTQVIRVREEDAPEILRKVNSAKESIDELIREVLEPTVINYFLNAAQQREALDFQEYRGEVQAAARQYIKEALKPHKIQAIDTLLGEISLPDKLTDPLRQSKIADQEIDQFDRQTKVEKKRQEFTHEKEMAKSAIKVAKEQQIANIAKIQRQERAKDHDEKLRKDRADLEIQKEKQNAELEKRQKVAEVEALAKQLMVDVDLKSEKEKKQIEADFQTALNKLDTDDIKFINTLGKDAYERMKTLEVSKQAEITGAIALIQASIASQSHELDKTKVIADALGQNNVLPNLQTVFGGEALEGISKHFGVQQTLLFNMLNQSNPSLISQLGLGALGSQSPSTSTNEIDGSTSGQSSLPQSVDSSLSENVSKQSTEPRCPVLLLIDTSAAMSGECVEKLNEGIATFKREIKQDLATAQRIEIAVVTFGNNAQTRQKFVEIDQLSESPLIASGARNMGQGLELALNEIDTRKQFYENQGKQSHKPSILLIMGGLPTDDWEKAAQRAEKSVEVSQLNLFVVGVEEADMATLKQISPSGTRPLMLDKLKFNELFHWFSDSMKTIANSPVGSFIRPSW